MSISQICFTAGARSLAGSIACNRRPNRGNNRRCDLLIISSGRVFAFFRHTSQAYGAHGSLDTFHRNIPHPSSLISWTQISGTPRRLRSVTISAINTSITARCKGRYLKMPFHPGHRKLVFQTFKKWNVHPLPTPWQRPGTLEVGTDCAYTNIHCS